MQSLEACKGLCIGPERAELVTGVLKEDTWTSEEQSYI